MQIRSTNFSSIEEVTGKYLQNSFIKKQPVVNNQEESFQQVLQKEVSKESQLKFTKHANERINSRHIEISDEQMQRLQDGANKAGEKGIKESLVLVDSLAFIVNTKQNTVITAMNQQESNENIYTNIDGAIIV